ncbi:MAG TPA: cyclic peptide export ABC transporter [Chthoniobacterales bacterium]
MDFLRFLERESKTLDRRLLILGALAALINMFIIFSLTVAAGKAVQGQSTLGQLLSVVLALAAYWLSEGFVMRRVTIAVEQIVQTVRVRIIDKIRSSDLASIESLGRAAPYNVVSTHAMNISRGATGIVGAFTASVLLVWAFLIILYISRTAFLILIAALAFLLLTLRLGQKKISASYANAVDRDNQFVHGFGDLIDGFKELKMNSRRAQDFIDNHLNLLAGGARDARTGAGLEINRSVLLATAALFIVLAALVFLLPLFSPHEAPKLVRLTTFVIFLFGPLGQVVGVSPLFNEAVASVREVQRVEALLDSVSRGGSADPEPDVDPPLSFNQLRCNDLSFNYRDEHGQPSFSLEPLAFELARGEMVFITGGNGSGKSTFLKVLAGLYLPAGGTISLDDRPVDLARRQSYRNLFSAVFSDFHLFDRIYGVEHLDQARLRRLLELTDLLHKISVVDGRLNTVNLSSGQRKRLALVLSLLEDRPILLLDEWAAEQDPLFRRKFYREILPSLKQDGKTVVAVTHDDDHYEVADRVLKMQFGKFVER